MDNRQFNVKGRTKDQLQKTLECFLTTEYNDISKVWGWKFNKDKGIILYYFTEKDTNAFMTPASIETLSNMLWDWLQSQQAKDFNITEMQDQRIDMDGPQHRGFRVYTEDWGRINNETYSLCALVPAYCWYGK